MSADSKPADPKTNEASTRKDSKANMAMRPEESRPLDKEEEKILKMLQEKLGKRLEKVSHNTIIRFIRGFAKEEKREAKTLEMLDACLKWREEIKADEIRVSSYPNEEKFHEMWPNGFHGVGKTGHPILVDRPGMIDPDKVFKQFKWEEIERFHIQMMERLVELKEKITKDSGELCYKHIVILDLEGIGLSHMGSGFRAPMKQLINIDQYFYPETLHAMVITNSSWIFKALWKICSPWIDPLTKQRIVWGKENLTKYMDKENIPQFLGGSCKCKDKKCLLNPFVSGKDDGKSDGTSSTTEKKEDAAKNAAPMANGHDKTPVHTNGTNGDASHSSANGQARKPSATDKAS
jgi:hypothetical protein